MKLIRYHILPSSLFVGLENHDDNLLLQFRSTKTSFKIAGERPCRTFLCFHCKISNIPMAYCNRFISIKLIYSF